MNNKTTLENWEERFDRQFNGTMCDGTGSDYGETQRDVKQFIKDLLASSQKDKEQAVEKPKFINYSFGTSEGLTNLANAIVYAADKITEALSSKGKQ